MYQFPVHRIILLILLVLVCTGITVGETTLQNWTNSDGNQVFNGPDKPTLVTFGECVKVHTITTLHWNWGKGDEPGKISLFHKDGAAYGPYDAFGENATDGTGNALWVCRPDEILKAGTYLVSDSNPATWSQNDGSDNRGITTIRYEPVSCMNEPVNSTKSAENSERKIPEGYENGVILNSVDDEAQDLDGGAITSEKVPVIDQIAFIPLYRSVTGGQNIYATLRVKNTGERDLEDGYITIRLISQDGAFSYRGGRGKLPLITVNEERDIHLIIPVLHPDADTSGTNILTCTAYLMDGTISERMSGGYFETRGRVSLPRDLQITVTGCCLEPYTTDTIRGCPSDSEKEKNT